MIRPIDIRLNAAHPELKLPEAVTYTGSPSTVLIRGVPPNYGRWAITAVSVAATFPDGSTTTRAAVQSANGVWVATLPATATSGRTTDGFRVIADGIDENGEAVTGYILCVADFAVASLGVAPAPQPGETSYQMLYFDEVPSVLRKGDVAKVDGVLKFYNGEAWEAFATPPTLDDAVTRTSGNGVKSSGIWSAIWGALASLPTGFTSLYDWVVDRLSGKLDASNGVATGLVTYLGTVNGFDYGLRFGTYGSDYAVQIVARSAGQQASWQATATLMLQKSKTGYAALLSDVPNVPVASTSTPLMDGTGSAGSSAAFARGDHRHPSDTSKVDDISGTAHLLKLVDGTNQRVVYFGKDASYSMTTAELSGGQLFNEKTINIPRENGTLALTAGTGHTGNLAELDASGNPTDAGWTAGDLARYALTTKTVDNGAVTLDDRAINIVTLDTSVTSATFTFPTHTNGKARDFFVRLIIQGTTVPTLYFNEPDGGGAVAFDADDDAWADIEPGVNLLMFTDTAE